MRNLAQSEFGIDDPLVLIAELCAAKWSYFNAAEAYYRFHLTDAQLRDVPFPEKYSTIEKRIYQPRHLLKAAIRHNVPLDRIVFYTAGRGWQLRSGTLKKKKKGTYKGPKKARDGSYGFRRW